MKEYDPNEFKPTRRQIEAIIRENARFSPVVETVSVEDALGRVAARDLCSLRDLPNTANCRWDGVAVRFEDFAGWESEGQVDTSSWELGREYVFGNTGIALPDGFDTLIRIEDVDIDGEGRLTVKRPPASRGEYTSARGSTLREGDPLVRRGQVLGPCHLGVLAMGGHTLVDVYRKPVVAIIPSGNELVGRTMALPRGKNVETNSLVLANKVRTWGAEPLVYGIVPDDYELLLAALRDAAAKADVVLFNAGSSKGTDDHAEEVLRAAGHLFFHRTSYGPGNHTGFCVVDGTPVLALVGVPGGAEFNADWYGEDLVRVYYGMAPRVRRHVRAVLDNGYRLRNFTPVQMYVRAMVRRDEGGEGYRARILDEGDGFAAGYADANAFILIEPEWGGVSAGQTVDAEIRLEPDGSCGGSVW